METGSEQPNFGLLSNSKKIKKLRSPTDDDTLEDKQTFNEDGKKYKTVDSVTKKKILLELKRSIVVLKNLEFKPEKLSTPELLGMLEAIELSQYNKILAQVLMKHFPAFNVTTKTLTQWRRKIKGWVLSVDKPENRGGLLIAHDKLPLFRQRVTDILKNMKARIFPELRNQILTVLEEFHYAGKDRSEVKKFNRNTCSKHWWFNFMRRNVDIKKLWESIPLERMLQKEKHSKTKDHKEDSTTDSSPDFPMHENLTLPSGFSNAEPLIKMPAFLIPNAEPFFLKNGLFLTKPAEEPIVKKEEDTSQSTQIVKKEVMAIEPVTKREEETKLLHLPLPKNEESLITEDTKIKIENLPNIPNLTNLPDLPLLAMPSLLPPTGTPQMDYLEMLLQRRRLIDMLIMMQLKEKPTEIGNQAPKQ